MTISHVIGINLAPAGGGDDCCNCVVVVVVAVVPVAVVVAVDVAAPVVAVVVIVAAVAAAVAAATAVAVAVACSSCVPDSGLLFLMGLGAIIFTLLSLDQKNVPHPVKHILKNIKNKSTNTVCFKFIKNSFKPKYLSITGLNRIIYQIIAMNRSFL
ncbi:MAG: hypothetical protein LBQ89_07125 [Treponema sp.]|nr:hypothetical protein [Treponema sp.]